MKLTGRYVITCLDVEGAVKWRERINNLVTTEGKNDLLTQYLKGAAYTAAFFVALKNASGGHVAGDTAASHGGWTESSGYSQGTRPALVLGTASGGSIDNSASVAVFSINASDTIYGAFIITNSTKGGTTGKLLSVGDFSVPRPVANLETLQVQWSLSA